VPFTSLSAFDPSPTLTARVRCSAARPGSMGVTNYAQISPSTALGTCDMSSSAGTTRLCPSVGFLYRASPNAQCSQQNQGTTMSGPARRPSLAWAIKVTVVIFSTALGVGISLAGSRRACLLACGTQHRVCTEREAYMNYTQLKFCRDARVSCDARCRRSGSGD
jgi:hypothetical protein